MRVLVTVQPIESHVRAIQQPVQALRRLGHEVLLAAPDKVEGMIKQSYDMPYVRAGQDWTMTPGIGEQLTHELTERGNRGFITTIIEEYLTGPTSLVKAQDIIRLIDDWKPQAILCDCTDIGALIAAWQSGLPTISLDNGWTYPLHDHAESIQAGLERHWPQLNVSEFLAALPPVITPVPVEFMYPDIPDMIDYRVEHPQRTRTRLYPWVADIPSDLPLIYVSYGSILTRVPGFERVIEPIYRRIIDALRDIPCRAVMSVGSANVRRLKEGAPDHIRLVPEIAQPLFLQAAVDVIVTPGGLGTIKELLTSGVTPVGLPLCSEHFHFASRIVETGLGTSAANDADPDAIAAAINTVLAQPSYRTRSRSWQRKALVLPSLEEVLHRRLP